LDRLGEHGVRELLGEGRKDESGDFTRGAGLEESQISKIETFVNARTTVQRPVFAYAVSRDVLERLTDDRDRRESEYDIALKIWGWLRTTFQGSVLAMQGLDELVEIA